MADVNSFIITGRLTADPELSMVGTANVSLLKFSVANNTGYGNKKNCTFFNCSLWGKRAETMKQYLFKGTQVGLVGQFTKQGEYYNYTITSIEILRQPADKEQEIPEEVTF